MLAIQVVPMQCFQKFPKKISQKDYLENSRKTNLKFESFDNTFAISVTISKGFCNLQRDYFTRKTKRYLSKVRFKEIGFAKFGSVFRKN